MIYRESLAAALVANGSQAVACAWDMLTMLTAIRETAATIVLLNISTRDSAALLRAARVTDANIRVVVLGVSDDDESEVIAWAEAGAAGYHTRTESFDDLLTHLRKAAVGEPFCSPRISSILLRRFSALATQQAPANTELVLTTREAQILDMLRLGLSNRDIADRLCIAVHTVKNHVHNILTKLGAGTRGEAAALASTLHRAVATTEDRF
ncbi:response regulator transcription factor [Mycolicibacterium cosmeticum]|uniref:response regulator transcription factor n=1 Tax=Mycolicibacterium cosmeticum TaxID=258533 RepID=UPI003204E1E6